LVNIKKVFFIPKSYKLIVTVTDLQEHLELALPKLIPFLKLIIKLCSDNGKEIDLAKLAELIDIYKYYPIKIQYFL